MRGPNPFSDTEAVGQSNYCFFDSRRLLRADQTPASSLTALVHDGFRALVLNDHFTCLGAKAAIRQGGYRFGLYEALGSPASTAGLARDLFTFVNERKSLNAEFTTFVASFSAPPSPDEAAFERLLWRTLQQLHDLDARYHQWDRAVVADVSSPYFAFSFAETAFFVVGLHAASSRATRRYAWPTLVFNPHDQFDRLKATGRYPRFEQLIREGEQALQGSINPMLARFGERSEASQYSGRAVGADWQCPFHHGARAGGEDDRE